MIIEKQKTNLSDIKRKLLSDYLEGGLTTEKVMGSIQRIEEISYFLGRLEGERMIEGKTTKLKGDK